jgi:hypothetical protein
VLTITFAARTRLHQEEDRKSQLPIHRNGPPGTFVLFPNGLRVSLPTDQIVSADVSQGCAIVVFGGMHFVGEKATDLIFVRARELWPEDALSPARSHTMVLDAAWVQSVDDAHTRLWSAPRSPDP